MNNFDKVKASRFFLEELMGHKKSPEEKATTLVGLIPGIKLLIETQLSLPYNRKLNPMTIPENNTSRRTLKTNRNEDGLEIDAFVSYSKLPGASYNDIARLFVEFDKQLLQDATTITSNRNDNAVKCTESILEEVVVSRSSEQRKFKEIEPSLKNGSHYSNLQTTFLKNALPVISLFHDSITTIKVPWVEKSLPNMGNSAMEKSFKTFFAWWTDLMAREVGRPSTEDFHEATKARPNWNKRLENVAVSGKRARARPVNPFTPRVRSKSNVPVSSTARWGPSRRWTLSPDLCRELEPKEATSKSKIPDRIRNLLPTDSELLSAFNRRPTCCIELFECSVDQTSTSKHRKSHSRKTNTMKTYKKEEKGRNAKTIKC